MSKQNKTIFWVIGIVVLVALIINSQAPKEPGMVGLNVHYYKDGVEVFPTKGFLGFSIVTPPGGSFDQISLDISGTATGVPFSNIRITDASPTAFKNALPSTTQSLLIGQSKKLWTSGLMNTVQFETMAQPVRFRVDVSAVNDYTKETLSRWGYVDLRIEEECISHDSYSCYNNDVYWYDSCGVREEKKLPDCGTSGYTGVNYCYLNDVYRDYVTRGCSGSSCTSSTEPLKQDECGALGCTEGVCNQPEEGTYLSSFPVYCSGAGCNPAGICTDGNYIWIVQEGSTYYNDPLRWHSMDGTYVKTSYVNSPGQTGAGSCTSDGSYIWVADSDGTVYVYGVDGWDIPSKNFDAIAPHGITTDGNYIWRVNTCQIYKYNMDGIYTDSKVWLDHCSPEDITTDGNYFWLLDRPYTKVHKYTMDGTYTGESWDASECGNNLGGITTDGNYIWIFDFYLDKVCKYAG